MTRAGQLAEEYAKTFMIGHPLCEEERELNQEIKEAISNHYLAGYQRAVTDAVTVMNESTCPEHKLDTCVRCATQQLRSFLMQPAVEKEGK